jgi:hypothetical protein
MRLLILEEPQLAFHQNNAHVDIRAGLGAFDKEALVSRTQFVWG